MNEKQFYKLLHQKHFCFFNKNLLLQISEVKERVQSLYHNSRKSFNGQEKKILSFAYNASKNLSLYKKEIRKNFGKLILSHTLEIGFLVNFTP